MPTPKPITLGIVGHAQDKFTPYTETKARIFIRRYILDSKAPISKITSGGCHLGGVDQYAKEIALTLNIPFKEYLPKRRRWEGGYRERNLLIAKADLVLCVVVENYPETYKGMRFDGCYHCNNRVPPHVKSGGCWTAWKCKRREWIII